MSTTNNTTDTAHRNTEARDAALYWDAVLGRVADPESVVEDHDLGPDREEIERWLGVQEREALDQGAELTEDQIEVGRDQALGELYRAAAESALDRTAEARDAAIYWDTVLGSVDLHYAIGYLDLGLDRVKIARWIDDRLMWARIQGAELTESQIETGRNQAIDELYRAAAESALMSAVEGLGDLDWSGGKHDLYLDPTTCQLHDSPCNVQPEGYYHGRLAYVLTVPDGAVAETVVDAVRGIIDELVDVAETYQGDYWDGSNRRGRWDATAAEVKGALGDAVEGVRDLIEVPLDPSEWLAGWTWAALCREHGVDPEIGADAVEDLAVAIAHEASCDHTYLADPREYLAELLEESRSDDDE